MKQKISHRQKKQPVVGLKSKKAMALLTSMVLLVIGVTAGTIAFLTAQSDPVVNTFTPGRVPNEVVEEFENGVKNNVQIQNNGNVDAYIRAAVVVTWAELDDEGNATGNVYHTVPVEGTDYTVNWSKEDWVPGADGFYYYTRRVAPQDVTGILFTECKPLYQEGTNASPNQPEGYVLSVEIMGQSIQADGLDSADNAPVIVSWGVPKGSVESVNADGSLVIAEGGADR